MSEPKDCFSGYYVTCSDNNNLSFNASLDKTNGECSDLISGTKYTIKSTVYHLNYEPTNHIVTACTSKFQ